MNQYQVGDKVLLKKELIYSKKWGKDARMESLSGTIVVIKDLVMQNNKVIGFHDCSKACGGRGWTWKIEQIECLDKSLKIELDKEIKSLKKLLKES